MALAAGDAVSDRFICFKKMERVYPEMPLGQPMQRKFRCGCDYFESRANTQVAEKINVKAADDRIWLHIVCASLADNLPHVCSSHAQYMVVDIVRVQRSVKIVADCFAKPSAC